MDESFTITLSGKEVNYCSCKSYYLAAWKQFYIIQVSIFYLLLSANEFYGSR